MYHELEVTMDVSVSGILHTPTLRSPESGVLTVLVYPCLYLYLYPEPELLVYSD